MSTETTTPRPLLKWAGRKRQLLGEIQERSPEDSGDYHAYVEIFIGECCIKQHLRRLNHHVHRNSGDGHWQHDQTVQARPEVQH